MNTCSVKDRKQKRLESLIKWFLKKICSKFVRKGSSNGTNERYDDSTHQGVGEYVGGLCVWFAVDDIRLKYCELKVSCLMSTYIRVGNVLFDPKRQQCEFADHFGVVICFRR